MENLPSNSHVSKERPEEEAKPKREKNLRVVQGEVQRRKKPLGSRFTEMFFGSDSKSVVVYVVTEVLLPSVKDMVADAVKEAIDRKMYGESRTARRSRPSGNNGYVPYNRYASPSNTNNRRDESRPLSRHARRNHNFEEIILETRHEAKETLDAMFDILEKYEHVSVADLYDIVGIDATHVDDKWGWVDLRGSDVRALRGGTNGYLLDLPKPVELN